MKVTIKEWNTVATWRWDIPEDDVCGICQIHFDGTCPTCKYPGDDCSLLSGKCGHNFHMHCIMEWIKQEAARGQCPMCRQSRWTSDSLLMTFVADELAAFEWVDQPNEGTLPVE
ncbi:hypothetical protein E4U60_003998 [Claviceps pazoutovae]|uniref:Anaphase-promoting complex subunit 11 n=1 Tax=Claviceps pazoutovae TaxID=1649127 RepID=A0A9P7MIM1_9HYPO|nr:hypothetical protein E4U60_003998 [Claviceps pazoutovae]